MSAGSLLFLLGYAVLCMAVGGLAVWIWRGGSKAKPMVFVRPWRPLSQEEIARAFQEWPTDDPRWRALWDWLGEEHEATMLELHRLPDTPEAMLVWKGRMQVLLHLRAQQIAWRGNK